MSECKEPTCLVHLVHVDEPDGALQGHGLPLLVAQEAEEVPGAHAAVRLGVLHVDHVDLLAVRQQVVVVLDLRAFQCARVGLVTFLTSRQMATP